MGNILEYEERLERIKNNYEAVSKRTLIYRGWVCDHPDVNKVFFVAYLIDNTLDKCGISLEILFNDNSRYSINYKEVLGIEGDVMELLAAKGDEYLRNGGKGTSFLMYDQFGNDLSEKEGLAIDVGKGTFEEARLLSELWAKYQPTIIKRTDLKQKGE